MAVEGSMEAEIIKSKLESFQIPVLLQYRIGRPHLRDHHERTGQGEDHGPGSFL
ncbi:MAG: hypothetical protein M0C28_19165 [Candidatus Moduliflexus flocculans]|nr:hypothetical protein [Candidatus Moduliflexus flocculans]